MCGVNCDSEINRLPCPCFASAHGVFFLGVAKLTLEVNHHFEKGGSFWMMINPYKNNGGSETNLKKNGAWTSRVNFFLFHCANCKGFCVFFAESLGGFSQQQLEVQVDVGRSFGGDFLVKSCSKNCYKTAMVLAMWSKKDSSSCYGLISGIVGTLQNAVL